MIAVDTNVLVYAHRGDAPLNERAHAAVTALAEGRQRWAIPWPCVAEFLSVCTHLRLYKPPSTVHEAVAQLDEWLASHTGVLLGERGSTWHTLSELVAATGVTGPRMYDARIAAICLDHRVDELWTVDRDFSRFPALRTRNPLMERIDD